MVNDSHMVVNGGHVVSIVVVWSMGVLLNGHVNIGNGQWLS